MEKFTFKRKIRNRKRNDPGRRFQRMCYVIALILIFIVPGFYAGMTVKEYRVTDPRIHGTVRIALITDLHSESYGKMQNDLLAAIDEKEPDLVLLGGDIFDDQRSNENTEIFLEAVSKKYPCYYVSGNHECWATRKEFHENMDKLKELGIPRLLGNIKELEFHGTKIMLCGVDDPSFSTIRANGSPLGFHKELEGLRDQIREDTYTILLSHRPERMDEYADIGFDLVLSGHAHGGQWRIPGIVNGIYAPNQGFFPKYCGGEYQKGKTTMIVSRGLAKSTVLLPRFYNQPELVIIELMGEK